MIPTLQQHHPSSSVLTIVSRILYILDASLATYAMCWGLSSHFIVLDASLSYLHMRCVGGVVIPFIILDASLPTYAMCWGGAVIPFIILDAGLSYWYDMYTSWKARYGVRMMILTLQQHFLSSIEGGTYWG